MDDRRGDAWTVRREDGTTTDDRTDAREPDRPAQRVPDYLRGRQVSEDHAVGDDGRGRSAEKPSDIPAQGWKDILLRVYRGISDDRILANAAAVTFYALLALFPAIAALVSIYGLFADPTNIEQQLDSVSAMLPGGAVDVIRDQLHRLVTQARGTLGISFLLGLAVSLWSANGGIKALFDALNAVYEEHEERSFLRLNAISLTFTVAMIAFLIIALSCIIALPVAVNYLPGFIGLILNLARWPVLLVLVALALACIYRYGSSRDEPKWRWLTWGSAFAALTWLGFSAIFSFYAGHFGTFNKTYGSLGAVIGFMTWMWRSVAVILIGAKLYAEIEHQTARDSTEGAPQPMGARQAKMADTVGEPQP
jgi:membrane protein